ncbi:MAG: UTP--glucose-1-phosphate uridylyltransferase, partial [Litorilinea sp.]
MSECIRIITATDPAVRDRGLDAFARDATLDKLLAECAALDQFRREEENLYARVRALFFLYALYRFHIPAKLRAGQGGLIPYAGYANLLQRRFEEAIDIFLAAQGKDVPGDGLASALAAAYHRLAFQTLADQVRRSVRSVRGNQWMFRIGHPADHPLRVRPELRRPGRNGLYPILRESTPVRMDLTHSGWSDIFFLGMDFPEGARVLNISVDLSVQAGAVSGTVPGSNGGENRETGVGESDGGEVSGPRPPIETFFRVIDRPILRLVSVDLDATAEIQSLEEVFDFARDYLGLIKAAVIASGLIPPGVEGSAQPLTALLARLVGPGKGIELVSQVNGIPKGSRLAVSTNLLASLIAVCMRATGQAANLTGGLDEGERRIVAARAILGEWLGGSGGGWQDSGGVWPGIKVIEGMEAREGDPELGVSRGRLLPNHTLLGREAIDAITRQRLQDSLVAVHGGMAQDVG